MPDRGHLALIALVVAALVAVPLLLVVEGRGTGATVATGDDRPAGGAGQPNSGGVGGPAQSGSVGFGAVSSAGPSPGASAGPSVSPAELAPAVVDPSGQFMPVGDLPGWKQVFADNFGTPVPLGQFPGAVSSRWTGYSAETDTSGHGTYLPSQVVSVSGGVMNLHLHSADGKALVAAPMPRLSSTRGSSGMLYGRYVVRFRADPVPGYKTAWLLWPDSDKWSDGEIDFPEADLTAGIEAFMHYRGNPQAQDFYRAAAGYTSWHTAMIEWTAESVTFTFDGKVIGRSTDVALIPAVPMHWVLQTETSIDDAAPSPSAAGNVQVDWITMYAKA